MNLINATNDRHYRHAIICLSQATSFRERIRSRDVEIVEIHKRVGKDLPVYVKVWRALRKMAPEIVHCRNIPTIDMMAPALLAGVGRRVYSEHGLDIKELDGRNRRYNRLRWLSRSVVHRYVAVSQDLAGWLHREIGIAHRRITVIPNGVDTDLFRPEIASPTPFPDRFAPAGSFVIGTVGRLESVKDQIGLAEAFVQILRQRPDLREKLRLVVVGDGTLRPLIEQILERAGDRSLAWLPGFVDDTPALYRHFHVFVLPSRREGLSNTLLEAMASGLPVIATRVGGNPEVVAPHAGLLVPPEDPKELALAILQLCDRPELARSLGRHARLHVERHFSLDAMVQGYRRLYDSL